LIESAGFDVCAEAKNGTEAIGGGPTSSRSSSHGFLYMPSLSGAEAAAVLKKRNPQIPIIVFTIFEDSMSTTLAKWIGVDRVNGKPDGVTKLVDSVRELLQPRPRRTRTLSRISPIDPA
jgi:DNA-binding NarL/FixJ family response regulator